MKINRFHPLPKISIVLVLLAFAPILTSAARGDWTDIDSVEWMSADSDLIVIGKVVEYSRDGMEGDKQWFKAVIRVTEPIKQSGVAIQAGASITVRFPVPSETRNRIDSSPANDRIYFLIDSIRRDTKSEGDFIGYPFAFRQGVASMDFGSASFGSGPIPITLDGRHLKEDKRLPYLCAAVAGETAMTRKRDWIAVPVPLPPDSQQILSPDPVDFHFDLRVPVDERLEQVARQWTKDLDYHAAAVYALSFFKNELNAGLLRSLMRDPHISISGEGKASLGYFYVRHQAYETLREWGIHVPRPAIMAPNDFSHAAWPGFWTAGILLFLVAVLGWRCGARKRDSSGTRRGIAQGIGRAGSAIILTLAITLAVLWVRQFFAVDEISFTTLGGSHWLSAYRGSLQFISVESSRRQPYFSKIPFMDIDFPDADEFRVTYASYPMSGGVTPLAQMWERIGNQRIAKGRFGFTFDAGKMADGEGFYPYRRYTMPLWPLVSLVAARPVLQTLVAATARLRRRRRNNQCESCGYDLRASAGRCPECGEMFRKPFGNDQR